MLFLGLLNIEKIITVLLIIATMNVGALTAYPDVIAELVCFYL